MADRTHSGDGNSEEPAPGQTPVDRWEEMLVAVNADVSQIAGDVSRIRQIVVAAWWLWWVVLTVCVVAYILA